ncbi:MAG TPA: hypothetical protein VF163_05340 [Micromonosporaceae bacterium]
MMPLDDPLAVASSNPGDPSFSLARHALAQFAGRNPATQADIDAVMRALVTHTGWFVPTSFAARAWGQSSFDQELFFPGAADPAVLSVFTDRESAMLADGQELGAYGGPVDGVRLMRSLDGACTALMVNPASPRQHQWYIATAGFEIAAGWASAVALEQALATRGAGPVPVAELLHHRYHLLLEQATQTLAQIRLPEIAGAVAVCFTATDRAEEFVASLPARARPLAELAMVDGPRMFDLMREVGTAGLVINAGSDDQTALTADDLAEIMDAQGTPPRR